MSDNKDINITVNTGNTVPLHMYERSQQENRHLASTIQDQKIELGRRDLIIDKLADVCKAYGANPEEVHSIKAIGMEI